MNFDKIHDKALKEGQKRHPDAPQSHHYSFASGVTYLVTGMSGGIGPTVRVHAVSHALAGIGGKTLGVNTNFGGLTMVIPDGTLPPAGRWDFKKACDFSDPICYGEITPLHFNCYRTEACFDDAEEDLEVLRRFRTGTK